MQIQQSNQDGMTVLTLAGPIDVAAVPQVQRAILKHLAQQPPAIICDLAQVEAIDPLCAGVFTSIRHPTLGWPNTTLVLCAPAPQVADILRRHGLARQLAIHPSLEEALANARARPPRLSERLLLGPAPTAARAGRGFVRQVCRRWGAGGADRAGRAGGQRADHQRRGPCRHGPGAAHGAAPIPAAGGGG
jgi:anti-anti-sigma factor